MSKVDYKRIRQYCENASDGPWVGKECIEGSYETSVWDARHNIADTGPKRDYAHGMTHCAANATFIASARTDLPALLDRCEELEEVIAAADELIFSIREGILSREIISEYFETYKKVRDR